MKTSSPMPLAVSAAVIIHNNRYLAARRAPGRSSGGLWEFPGGKIEAGETPEIALIREIREELALEVTVGDALGVFSTEVSGTVIELHCFYAYPSGYKNTQPIEVALNDHSEIKWCDRSELKSLEWAQADIPVVAHFLKL